MPRGFSGDNERRRAFILRREASDLEREMANLLRYLAVGERPDRIAAMIPAVFDLRANSR